MKGVITAGGRIAGSFASRAGTEIKALARVRGTTMLARAIAALRGAGADRIAVVGSEAVRTAAAGHVERFVAESPLGSENLLRALRAWDEDGEALVYATSDLPYVTATEVSEFVRRVPEGALAMPLVESETYAVRFPGAPPYGLTLAGERVVNGGIFIVPPGGAARIAGFAAGFFDARKRPWQMAALVGPVTLLRLLVGRLSVGELERRARRALQMPALAIRNCAPEVAFDVDTEAEYCYACNHD